jgi:hypothetical protein
MFENSLYRLHSWSACVLANVSACLDGSQLGHPEYMGVHTVLGVCVGAGNAIAHMFIKQACSRLAA